MKFFGVLILISWFERKRKEPAFHPPQSRASVSLLQTWVKKTGMSRDHFNAIMSHLVWSAHPKERPEGMSLEAHRWMQMWAHMKNFNTHCEQFVLPAWLICVDESIVKRCVGVNPPHTGRSSGGAKALFEELSSNPIA